MAGDEGELVGCPQQFSALELFEDLLAYIELPHICVLAGQAEQLKSHRAPPCRFDFFHIVHLKILIDKLTKIEGAAKKL